MNQRNGQEKQRRVKAKKTNAAAAEELDFVDRQAGNCNQGEKIPSF